MTDHINLHFRSPNSSSSIGAGSVSLRIESDRLGPTNKILSFYYGDRRIKSKLYPVNVGTRVELTYQIGRWYALVNGRLVMQITNDELRPPAERKRLP